MSENYDVIVIGSGIGGMTLASTLAKRDVKVLVLEAHTLIGGYCHSFKRKKFSFYSSVLKTCGLKFKGIVDSIYKELGLPALEWIDFPENIHVEDRRYCLGEDELFAKLSTNFPSEKNNIERFEQTVTKLYSILAELDTARQTGNMSMIDLRDMEFLKKYRNVTLKDMVDDYFDDEELKTTMIAMVDGKMHSSIFAFVVTVLFAFRGARMYQPKKGGFYRVINELADYIQSHDGKILKRHRVNEIIVKDGRAVGVRCKNQKEFYAPIVISCSDLLKTLQMLDEQYIPQRLLSKVKEKWRTSCSCFTVWLGLSDTLENIGLPQTSSSYYSKDGFYKKLDILEENSTYREDDSIFFSTMPSLDQSCTPEGKSQMIIGMLVGKNFENLWDSYGTPFYEEKKEEITSLLIKRVEQITKVSISEHIEIKESATPYTYYRYTSNQNGATEGFEVAPNYINDSNVLRGKPIIEGLYAASMWSDDGGGVVAVMAYSMKVVDVILQQLGKPKYDFFEKNFTFDKELSYGGKSY